MRNQAQMRRMPRKVEAATNDTADVIVTEDDTDTKEEGVAVAAKPEDTVILTPYDLDTRT